MSPTSYQTAPPRDTGDRKSTPARTLCQAGLFGTGCAALIRSSLNDRCPFGAYVPQIYHRIAQSLSEDRSSAVELVVRDVRIDVARHGDVGVPELLLRELQASGLAVDDAAGEMTERVKTRLALPCRDARLLERDIETLAPKQIRIEGTAVGSTEDEAVRLAQRRPLPVLGKDAFECR